MKRLAAVLFAAAANGILLFLLLGGLILRGQ